MFSLVLGAFGLEFFQGEPLSFGPKAAYAQGVGLFKEPLKASEEFSRAPWSAQMEALVAQIKRRFKGGMAVYVSDPYRGYRWGYQENELFYLASAVKTTFMLEAYRQRASGELSFKKTVEYTEDDIRDGAPRVNKQKIGAKLTVELLLDWMMRSSDNAASDMIAKTVGIHKVNPGLEDEGIPNVSPVTYLVDVRRGIYRNVDIRADDFTAEQVRKIRWTRIWTPQINKLTELLGLPRGSVSRPRLMAAYDQYYATMANTAPMSSMGLLFEKMARGELVDTRSSRDMIDLMSEARTSTHRLLGRLPKGTRVAHKTGSQFKRLCDMGIIFLPDGLPLIVAACMQNGDVRESEDAVARLARRAYDLAIADHKKP